MAFPPEFLEELKTRTRLSDVVGRHVALTKKGRELTGLCPFHQEKTPSFWVNDEKGVFHCFGCGASGDALEFVMRTEGLAFRDALEKLAQAAGLEVPAGSREDQEAGEKRQTLLGALEIATAYFKAQLRAPGGTAAVAYLKARGVSGEVAARFHLGFAPDRRGALYEELRKANVPENIMIEAGLVGRSDHDGTLYDRFRDRIIFPITDVRGRVIGFGGRTLGDGKPKYLNSPETPLFHKSRVLYGLGPARKAAYDTGEIIVAEGYMDVIALSQAGFRAAVAPLGTALTEDHLRLLWRGAPEPVLCFDGDAAGQRAAARAAERALALLAPGYSLRFAYLPAGEDPDSLIQTAGPAAMRALITEARPLVDQLWAMETADRRFETPERRARLDQRLEEITRQIADPAVRRHYRDAFFRLSRQFFGEKTRKSGGLAGRGGKKWRQDRDFGLDWGPNAGEGTRTRLDAARLRQRILLATLVNHLSIMDEVAEELGTLGFADGQLDRLRQEVINVASLHPDIDSEGLKDHLRTRNLAALVDQLLAPDLYRHAFFARPEASPEEAVSGFRDTLARYRREMSAEERAAMERDLAEDMSEESWSRFLAQKEEELARDGNEDEGGGAF
ncbi:MAG: DNA primase [Alphaproteobacteria bacterium]